MTVKELELKKAELQEQATNIVEARDSVLDTEALDNIKSIKEEVSNIDATITAIKETRSMAKEVEKETKVEVNHFEEYLRGNITEKEAEQRMLTVGTANKAGDLVPDAFLEELFEAVKEFGAISGKARHISTSDNGALTIPMIDNTKDAGVWVDEAGKLDIKDLSVGTVEMNAYKIGTGIEVTTELLEDSFFDLSSYIAKTLGERIARATEDSFLNGNGTKKPEGILVNTDTITVTSAKVAVVAPADLLGMIHKLAPSQRAGAEFLVSDPVIEQLLLAVDANGRPLLQAAANASQKDGVQYTLGGYNITANYDLGDIVTGKDVAVFGNLNNYLIRDVRNVSVKRDDFTGMSNDTVAFYATARLDGKVISANKPFAKLTVK